MTKQTKQLLLKGESYLKRARRLKLDVPEDVSCEMMATLGFSNRAIRAHTGLTDNQIQLRLKRANIKRVDYRDAISPIGKAVVFKLDGLAEKKLVEHIERYLLK